MDQEQDEQKDRCEGKIDEGQDAAGLKCTAHPADGGEVPAEHSCTVRGLFEPGEYPAGEQILQLGSGKRTDPSPAGFGRAVDSQQEHSQQREPDQRVVRSRGQDTIIDLQHVERSHQEQKVRRKGKPTQCHEIGPQALPDLKDQGWLHTHSSPRAAAAPKPTLRRVIPSLFANRRTAGEP